jgi:hypothetical protein
MADSFINADTDGLIQIISNEAQLEYIDGNVMSPEAAQAFVATLP